MSEMLWQRSRGDELSCPRVGTQDCVINRIGITWIQSGLTILLRWLRRGCCKCWLASHEQVVHTFLFLHFSPGASGMFPGAAPMCGMWYT